MGQLPGSSENQFTTTLICVAASSGLLSWIIRNRSPSGDQAGTAPPWFETWMLGPGSEKGAM